KLDYLLALQDLDIELPAYYTDLSGQALSNAQRQEYWDFLGELEQFRQEAEGGDLPSLTFLGDTAGGWRFRQALPDACTTGNIAVEDTRRSLDNEYRLLQTIDPSNPAYLRREQVYRQLLNQLGLNLDQRELLKQNFGEIVGTLYTLNRINLIME